MVLKEELGGFFIEKFKFFYIYIVKLVKIYIEFFFFGKYEYFLDYVLEYFFNFLDLCMNIILVFL